MKYEVKFNVKITSTVDAATELEALKRLKEVVDSMEDTKLLDADIQELGEAKICSCGSAKFYANTYSNKIELECENCGEIWDLHE